MLYTFDDLRSKFKDHVDLKGKIQREIKAARLTPVARGLYESDPQTPGHYLAIRILSPSYLSFAYALAHYSLIPEAVYNCYTSATFKKRKAKRFENHFGLFLYRDVPAAVYPLGVQAYLENGYVYHLACPEKALCDQLYMISPVGNLKAIQNLLFEDLRIDEEDFFNLDRQILLNLATRYHTRNLDLLTKLIKRNTRQKEA